MSNNTVSQWQVFPSADEVADAALKLILEISSQSIQADGIFRIVLAGGTTPKNIYKRLVKQPCEWNKWHLYLGDERCLQANDEERNSLMIQETLLDQIDMPDENIHFIPAELGAELSAKIYAEDIKNILPFDLVLLGMGEDGHTASLFPGHIHDSNEQVHAVYNSPKPPSDRVSISAQTLSQNKNVLMIVTGQSKQVAVEKWQNDEELPIATISSLKNKIVMLDEAAIAT